MLLFYLLIAFYVFIVAFMMAIYVYSVYSSFCCLEPVYEVGVVLASSVRFPGAALKLRRKQTEIWLIRI